MKKVFMAALALTMAVFVSCSKDDFNVENNDVKVNFTVAEKPSFDTDTRAVKTKWANGDQILIFLATAGNVYYVVPETDNNTITLSYNGSTWTKTQGTLSDAITDPESAGGRYVAVHYRGNVGVGANFRGDALLANYEGGEYMTYNGTYTKTDGVIELGELTLAYPDNAMYVSIKGLATLEDKDWKLKILDENYTDGWNYGSYFAADAFKAGDLNVTNQFGYIRGINNVDGSDCVVNGNDCSFFFVDKEKTSTKYTFYLEGTNCGPYTYTTTAPVVGGSAYLLPELILDADNKPTSDCKWNEQ